MIAFRCEAGGEYGLGHAMRARAITQEVHALVPEMPLTVVGTTAALEDVFSEQSSPVTVRRCHGEGACLEVLRNVQSIVVDMPMGWQENRLRLPGKHVVWIDAPWASNASHDTLILPGVHHDMWKLGLLREKFQGRLHAGAEYVVLPRQPKRKTSWAQREDTIVFAAGGSDPYRILPRLHELTRCLDKVLPNVRCVYLSGQYSYALSGCEQNVIPYQEGLEHLWRARLAVVTWGITAYECWAARAPMLIVPQSHDAYRDAQEAKKVMGSPCEVLDAPVQSLGCNDFSEILQNLWEALGLRTSRHFMYPQSARRLDGNGAKRIAGIIVDVARAG